MKQIEAFKTTDGQLFESRDCAVAHEVRSKLYALVRAKTCGTNDVLFTDKVADILEAVVNNNTAEIIRIAEEAERGYVD